MALTGTYILPMAVGHCKAKARPFPTNPSIILLMALQGTYILPMAVGHWIAIGIGHYR